MKNNKQNLIVLLLSFVLLISFNSFGSENKDSLYVIEIDGRVLIPKKDDSKIYKVEILFHNTVVDTGTIVDDESFLLKIKKDSWYTIRILKEGYHPLSVAINTELPQNNKNSYSFHFDTELISKTKTISDEEAVDFPIAIIAFNEKQDDFMPIMQYTKNIKKSLFEPVVKEGVAQND